MVNPGILKRIYSIPILMVFIFLSSCTNAPIPTPATPTPTSGLPTPSPTNTRTALPPAPSQSPPPSAAPTNTPFSARFPAVIAAWDGVIVDSLCLDVQESYPQFENGFSIGFEERLTGFLSDMGVRVVSNPEDCPVTLHLELVGRVYAEEYKDPDDQALYTCFTGITLQGNFLLDHHQFNGIEVSQERSHHPTSLSDVSRCPTAPSLDHSWDIVLKPVLALSQIELWGLPAAAAAVNNSDDQLQLAALAGIREMADRAAPLIPLLIQVFEEENEMIKLEIASTLGEIGPDALQAVPFLITQLDLIQASPVLESMDIVYLSALENITGMDFQTAPEWQTWWDENNLEDGEQDES